MASRDRPAQEGETFEALYSRLEQTVQRLENGGLTLEESLALFEEGMELARRCQEMLDKAEQRIARLQQALSEQLGGAPPAQEAGYFEPEEPEDLPDEAEEQ